MFHDLTIVIEPEDVDARPIAFPWPFCAHVHDYIIALSDHPHEMRSLSQIRLLHPAKVLNEGFLPVRDARIVLNVHVPNVLLDRYGRLALVEHEIIERQDIFLFRSR